MAKHKKKKNKKNNGNYKKQNNKNNKQINKKTNQPQKAEKVEKVEKTEKVENIEKIEKIQSKEFLLKTCAEAKQIWKKFLNFIIETKKVSVPVMIAVYTVVIVSAALIADNSYNKRRLAEEEARLIEEISNTQAHSADMILEKDITLNTSENCSVTYRGFLFTNRVTAQNAEKYSDYYENTAENSVYLDVIIDYENKSESDMRADTATVMTVNDGKRDYPCFAAAETDGGKNIEFASGQTIHSGGTVRLHHIFDVPKTLENDSSTLSAKVVIDNVGYVIKLRE